jgi:nickel transport protein
MSTPRQLSLILACLAATALPAHAHRLKVFATVEEEAVTGYGFFVGGGRPQGATVIMRDAGGQDLWRGETDDQGRYSWRPENPMTLTVIIDARDGHIAEAKIPADRFAAAPTPETANAKTDSGSAVPTSSSEMVAAGEVTATAAGGSATALDEATLAQLVDRAVDKAVARQIRPLLEAFEEASGAIRFNDIMGGVGMIVGLAGMGMWIAARKRKGPHGRA